MRRQIASGLICLVFCFAACKKTAQQDGVSLRIQNSTSQNFIEVITNNKTFTNVGSSEATAYKHFDQVVDAPFAVLVSGNDTAYAGYQYFDPPIYYLPNGKYTLKIVEDTSVYYGYNCTYIKD